MDTFGCDTLTHRKFLKIKVIKYTQYCTGAFLQGTRLRAHLSVLPVWWFG